MSLVCQEGQMMFLIFILWNLQVKVIDTIKYRKIYEEVMKKLDKLENEFLPQVTVDKLEVSNGERIQRSPLQH